MRLDCLTFKQSKKISFRKNFLENLCRTDMENFNHKVQSSHPRESAVLVVLFVHPSHVYQGSAVSWAAPQDSVVQRWMRWTLSLRDLGLNWDKYKNRMGSLASFIPFGKIYKNTRISEVPQGGERPSLLEVKRKSMTFQLDLEMWGGVCPVRVTRLWFRARGQHLQTRRGGSAEPTRGPGGACGHRVACTVGEEAWSCRRAGWEGAWVSGLVSRPERILCHGVSEGVLCHADILQQLQSRGWMQRLDAGRPAWAPRLWCSPSSETQPRHCFRKPSLPMAGARTCASWRCIFSYPTTLQGGIATWVCRWRNSGLEVSFWLVQKDPGDGQWTEIGTQGACGLGPPPLCGELVSFTPAVSVLH